jgi:hypothetical protein
MNLLELAAGTLNEGRSNGKVAIMSDVKEKQDECKLSQTDSEGNANLCCCYILEDDGRIQDPCYLPVDECCSEQALPR